MSLVLDVTADLPAMTVRLAVQEMALEEVASLAEELVAYHQHFAPLFSRREQREWAAVYLRGLLTADVPRKNVEAMALRLLGVGSHAERQMRALQQFIREGGSFGARLFRANFEQIREEAVNAGFITNEEIAQVLMLLDDPDFAISSHVMFTAWGRRSEP